MNPGTEKPIWAIIYSFLGISARKPGKSGRITIDNHYPGTRKQVEVGLMIDEINYFPERENYQKKKKVDTDWKELKKQKVLQDSKKTKKPNASGKSKPPQKEK